MRDDLAVANRRRRSRPGASTLDAARLAVRRSASTSTTTRSSPSSRNSSASMRKSLQSARALAPTPCASRRARRQLPASGPSRRSRTRCRDRCPVGPLEVAARPSAAKIARTSSTFSCDIAYPRSSARRSAAARASSMSVDRKARDQASTQTQTQPSRCRRCRRCQPSDRSGRPRQTQPRCRGRGSPPPAHSNSSYAPNQSSRKPRIAARPSNVLQRPPSTVPDRIGAKKLITASRSRRFAASTACA